MLCRNVFHNQKSYNIVEWPVKYSVQTIEAIIILTIFFFFEVGKFTLMGPSDWSRGEI